VGVLAGERFLFCGRFPLPERFLLEFWPELRPELWFEERLRLRLPA